jgi:signal transduction histidine kinase
VIVHTSFKNDAVKYPLHLERFSTHVVGEHPCCEHFVVSVHDTGTGIAMENLPMIFEEFKQESHGYNRTYEGNGLGLTISSRLALAMGGSIEVQSAKGIGSTFIVRLPLTHESAMSN